MRLFIILSRVPYPLEKGDKLRAYNHIKYLSQNNEITLCALNTGKLHKDALKNLQAFCKSITIINLSKFRIFLNLIRALFTGKPFQVEYFYSRKAQRTVDRLIFETKPDHILCQLIRVSEYVKDFRTKKTLDYQDVFSRGIERRIALSPLYMVWFLRFELKRLLKYENEIFSYFDNKIIISKADRDRIPHPFKEQIVVIPNGVDTDYFNPVEKERHFDLLFIGNMGYYPNIISAVFLAKTILPELHKTNPDVKLLIAGANPHRKVKALKSEKVSVSGWVDDMRDCYSNADIFIAPMLLGTGLQNKLLEAMAMKLACVISILPNEALEAVNGKDLIVCENVKEYADAICSLIDDKNKYDMISNNGMEFVKKKYNWETLTSEIEQILNKD